MRLWLDDERDPKVWLPDMGYGYVPEDLPDWKWAKTAAEAIAILENNDVAEVSLDHDLGDATVDESEVGTGYQVISWIEERTFTDPNYTPPLIHIHTSNLGARDRMEAAKKSIEHHVANREQSTE